MPINWLLIRINARVIGDSFAAARGMGRGRCQPGDLNLRFNAPPAVAIPSAPTHRHSTAALPPPRLALLSSARQISFRWLLPLMAMSSACTCTTPRGNIKAGRPSPNNLALERTRCTYRHRDTLRAPAGPSPMGWPRPVEITCVQRHGTAGRP